MKPTFRKIYGGDGKLITNRRDPSLERKIQLSEVPVEKQMSPEALKHLHSCIHFTHTFMKKECDTRIIDGAGLEQAN